MLMTDFLCFIGIYTIVYKIHKRVSMMKKKILGILACLSLIGCASQTNYNDPLAVKRDTQLGFDEYTKCKTYTAPILSNRAAGRYWTDYTLFANNCGVKPDRAALIIDYHSREWGNFVRSRDIYGSVATAVPVKKKVFRSGWIQESVMVMLTRTYLEKNRQSGIRLRLEGNGGQPEFILSPAYIDGFLMAVDHR